MEEEKTYGGTKSGSCKNRGLHGRGKCGLCVFVVCVVEGNVVCVKPQKTHGGLMCGSCVFLGSHEPRLPPPYAGVHFT